MKVFILPESAEFPPMRVLGEGSIVTVFLRESKGRYPFRCTRCGRIVFQYIGELDSMFEGAVVAEEKVVLDAMCPRCKVVYRAVFLPVV